MCIRDRLLAVSWQHFGCVLALFGAYVSCILARGHARAWFYMHALPESPRISMILHVFARNRLGFLCFHMYFPGITADCLFSTVAHAFSRNRNGFPWYFPRSARGRWPQCASGREARERESDGKSSKKARGELRLGELRRPPGWLHSSAILVLLLVVS